MNRVIVSVIAVALMGFAPAALAASSAPSTDAVVGHNTKGPVAKAGTRVITEKIVAKMVGGKKRFYIRGTVEGDYKVKPVFVQKCSSVKTRCTSGWVNVTSKRTNWYKQYNIEVAAKKSIGDIRYRIRVPATGAYTTSYSPGNWYISTTRR